MANNQHKGNKNTPKKNQQGQRNTNPFKNIELDTFKYVGAPYNFVSFSEYVYEYDKDVTPHNSMEEELQTGEITYEITAQTPIIVDDGKGNFCKNANGQYAIPGSTMRGLIRNNVQILGLASLNDDIDDYMLMYRNVAGGIEKKNYNTILDAKTVPLSNGEKKSSVGVLKKVKAGYVEKVEGKYVIYQTTVDSIKKEFGEMNYYVLSERKVVKDYLDAQKKKTRFHYEAFRENGKSIMQHEFRPFKKDVRKKIVKKIVEGEMKEEVKEEIHYIGTKNNNYKPYYKEISYEISGDRDITAVGLPGKYKNKGYAMSTGKMNEKKAIYIIPEIDKTKETIEISEQDLKAFQIDLKKKENTLKSFGGKEFFDLPKEEGEIKPIFYITLGSKLYFGFTPRLRLFYDYTIKHGLKECHKPQIIDYSKAIFGYSMEDTNNSYKSRVSFADAVVSEESKNKEEARKLILGEPKPTSYMDYLINPSKKEEAITYNNKNFELRGIKQYWLHQEIVPTEVDSSKEKVASTITPLGKGTKFVGKVRFQNLTKDELGLLLWSIRLKENSWMNVGKAKAYGYGAISVRITDAKILDKKAAYCSEELILEPFRTISVDEMIQIYKDKINQFLKGRNIEQLPHIKEFFAMKDSSIMPKPGAIRYMQISKPVENGKKENEYQNRKKVLPPVERVVNKKN